MEPDSLVECTFLIPRRRDADLSDGQFHSPVTWQWLHGELYERFGGRTVAPGWYEGFYRDADTGLRVDDQSKKFIVALPANEVTRLRKLLAKACVKFRQKCIYLSVAGDVEFVEAKDHEPENGEPDQELS